MTLPVGYAQARDLVRSRFGIAPTRVRRLSAQDTIVYRVDSSAGSFVLRSHGEHSEAEIASVPMWLEALRSEGVEAPEPMRTLDGSHVAGHCTLVRYVDGRIQGQNPSLVHFERLGRTMAVLHTHAETWSPPASFTRPTWRAAEVFCERGVAQPPGGDPWALLPTDVEPLVRDAAARARGPLDGHPTHLIHADLHLGNVVFVGGRVRPFDFDDTGYGALGYDVASALSAQRLKPTWPRVLSAFAQGYETVRTVPDLDPLDDFIVGRLAGILLWLVSTAETMPRVKAGLPRWIPHLEAQLTPLMT